MGEVSGTERMFGNKSKGNIWIFYRTRRKNQGTSVMHLIREGAWMTAALEDATRAFSGIIKFCREQFVLLNRFRSLLPESVKNIKTKVSNIMESTLGKDSHKY